MNDRIKIVSAVNDFTVYDREVRHNPRLTGCDFFPYDNTRENSGVAERYNDFIDNHLGGDDWGIFCHQDFGFEEDPRPRLATLSPKYIYGPVGINLKWRLSLWPPKIYRKKVTEGQFRQGRNNEDFTLLGNYLKIPRRVRSCDCCCLIVHGSLLHRYRLRFDPRCAFHLYAEDFQLVARKRHGIVTRAVQLQCHHLGIGNYGDPRFFETLAYLKQKHQLRKLFSTNPYC